MQILITANSPGELAGWAKPVIFAFKKNNPELKIRIILLPCTFASGQEYLIAKEIEGVEEVYKPKEYFTLFFKKKNFKDALLLHLGGDLMYAAILARYLSIPAFAYQWANRLWDKFFKGYFVKTEKDFERLVKLGISKEKIFITGDLLVDFLRDFKSNLNSKDLRIVFLPGSRVKEVKVLTPFYLKAASLIKKELKEAEFYLLISPFLKKEKIFLKEILPDFKMGGIKGICQDNQILSQDGTKLEIINQNHYQIMQGCSFAITIPGTKTGELGVLGKPMLVILPLNRADIIPYIGLIGALDYLGNFGKYIKSIILKKIAQKFGFISQPNILAQKEIVPEMMSNLAPDEVAQKALELLKDKRKLEIIQEELRELYKEHQGASKRLAEVILK